MAAQPTSDQYSIPMTRSLLLFITALMSCVSFAQVPQAISYQAAARDQAGNALADQAVSVRFRVHTTSAFGTVVYSETHSTTTSEHGLFSLSVGLGTPESGSFGAIDWASGPHFLEVGLDTLGGSDFVMIGSQQLMSVPYALHAGSTTCLSVSLLGDTLRQSGGCYVVIPGISAVNGGCGDVDGDGYYAQAACPPVDCNDNDPAIHPGATELCNDGVDNDCDGTVENATTGLLTWYPDADSDGYGNTSAPLLACAAPIGYIPTDGDCDDGDATIHPGVLELCDGKDNDCNGTVDDGPYAPGSATYWVPDIDGDGYGGFSTAEANGVVQACTQPVGYVLITSDCDPFDATVHPNAPELCDSKDNDCNGQVDEGGVCDPCPGMCSIGGACFTNGQTNPGAPCLVCNTALSTTTWSLAEAGTICNTGNACTTFICNASGSCVQLFSPAGTACDDGDPNTSNDTCTGTGQCIGTP